ncbi:hypothetical protein M2277_005111 [Paenibacillus sp. LBL]|uniref:YonK family protein n=1 Tax=Paenibacillus sp. LBL TaxID=2940563 RepID=UPI00247439A4|nr:YonK family protein [Paenibacillus sp. LBL]MDH6674419.1 hypothetical protein [Paenibacillus sp. LBL]
MAKRVHSISLKGRFEDGMVTEETKHSDEVYDLFALINEFEGKEISVTIQEVNPIPAVG